MIRVRNVAFGYRPQAAVLEDVSLDIGCGMTVVVGPNGCGKTTLLKLLAGVERPDAGNVEIDGLDLWQREVASRQRLAYVPENADITPYASIQEVVDFVCRLRSEPRQSGLDALGRAGLLSLSSRSVRELSMGQQRRIMLALAWIGAPPRVLVLDEPLESMDRAIRSDILLWLDRAAITAAVVVASHQIDPFAHGARRAVAMNQGRCRLIAPLPEDATERLQLFRSLALGHSGT
jgi:ABC-type multidrug transport system ATPase subunit